MFQGKSTASILAITLLVGLAFKSRAADDKRTLIINGQSTHVSIVRVNGQVYVDLEALTSALSGSLSSSENTIALSIPNSSQNSSPSPTTSSHTSPQDLSPKPGFSREFLAAGIEQMSSLREWHTALATAIQSGIPLSSTLLSPYRAQATMDLHLASVAATTSSDRDAYRLLNNEFQNMVKLSDKYANKRANMSYISPDVLENDSLNQRIIACGHSLGAMAASGQFVDDGSCN